MGLPRNRDAAALALITRDVVLLGDSEMAAPTPCEGWSVGDLVVHMSDEHEAVSELVLGPLDVRADDPRHDFPVIAARWIVALDRAGRDVMVPKMGRRVSTERVWAVHLVDMLVHRWDLAKALGRPEVAPVDLTDAALPIARAITAPGSPLVGRAYGRPVADGGASGPLDSLAALLGRDLAWTAPPR